MSILNGQTILDPLAQSFFVSNGTGVFITKVRVYFASKPEVGDGDIPIPVICQIRPMVNGAPSSTEIIPGAIKHLLPSEVTVVSTATQDGVLAEPTDFEFDEPIYLRPNEEYAIVLLANTTDYNVYVANLGEYVLGTTEVRITSQPSMGSLFKSQNGSTWTPSQTQDLTFQLFNADFADSGGIAILENANVPVYSLPNNPVETDSGSRWATIVHPNHGLDSGDAVVLYGLDSSTTYAGVLGTSIIGSRTVNHPDQTGYRVYLDSAATSTTAIGGTLMEATQNVMFNRVNPYIETLTPDGTHIDFYAKYTTGKSYAGTETRFVKDTAFKYKTIKEIDEFSTPRMLINPVNEATQLGAGVKSSTMQLKLSSVSTNIMPVIDMQRASLIMTENVIDKQDSDRDTAGFNTPLSFVAETSPSGGSHAAKHITIPITLNDASVGLKILLGANRPSVADFLVYYRVATESEILSDKDWVLLAEETNNPSDEDPTVFREYRYLAGGQAGNLTPFTQYQVKIVFRSTNSSKIARIKDLRIIALID